MPSLSDHTPSKFVRLLYLGASGTGKTGSLTPLVKAGYKLRILDLDGGLDALVNHVKEECPDKLSSIQYNSFRDNVKMTPLGPVVQTPKAYVNTLRALEKWPDDGTDPATFGDDTIVVLDSLTNAGRAAFQWARAMNKDTKDPRQWYKAAQDVIEDLIANLTSESFATHVIVITHVDMMETKEGFVKGYASSIGRALGPKIPRFFNTMILAETKGQGERLRRMISTIPTNTIDLKNPAPMRIDKEYPLETGLAAIFTHLRG